MKTIDKIAWLLLREGRVLSTRSKGKDVYYLPGGKREKNETDAQTLVREIREELSVAILPRTAELYGIFRAQAHGHPPGVCVQMTCYFAAYEGELRPNAEIEEIVWLTYADIEKVSAVDKIIFQDLVDKKLLS